MSVSEASTSILGSYDDDEDDLGGLRDRWVGGREKGEWGGGLLYLRRHLTYYMYLYIEQKQYLVYSSQGFYELCTSNQ